MENGEEVKEKKLEKEIMKVEVEAKMKNQENEMKRRRRRAATSSSFRIWRELR